MTSRLPQVSHTEARRLLLRAQGLSGRQGPLGAAGGSTDILASTVEKLGYVQLDSINVLARAQELILHSRLSGYRHEEWHRLLAAGKVFEHWTHDAAIIPNRWLPYWHLRFERADRRIRASRWWMERLADESAIERVRDELRRRGPLMARDLAGERSRRGGVTEGAGWWNWRPEKAALEYLWHTGQVMVVERRHFHKVYHLTEAHLSKPVSPASRAETVDWACREAVRRLGVATPSQLAAFWGLLDTEEARAWSRQLPTDCVAVLDPAGRPAVAIREWRQVAEEARPGTSLKLLAPFDPVVHDRARTRLLFEFDYRFEAFVPQAQRVYGYYTLPILDGERLVGRVTPRLDRRRSRLEVQHLHWEPGVVLNGARQRRFDLALQRLAAFVGATDIQL